MSLTQNKDRIERPLYEMILIRYASRNAAPTVGVASPCKKTIKVNSTGIIYYSSGDETPCIRPNAVVVLFISVAS